MSRRQREPDGEAGRAAHGGGSLRWLLTYADMITLLMAFFIMLYSMSILNMGKFQQVAVSIRSGFAGPVRGRGPSDKPGAGIRPVPADLMIAGVPRHVVRELQDLEADKVVAGKMRLREDERGLVISLATDKAVFTKGQASLSPNSMKIVDKVADAIRGIPNSIRVEGHTCDLPVSSERYPSNWELSTARATAVVRYLVEDAWISPARLSAAGYADSRPLAPNTSEANRAQNRRVDIIIMRSGYSDER